MADGATTAEKLRCVAVAAKLTDMGVLNLLSQPRPTTPLELAGFRLSLSEWDEFDEDSQAEILHLLGADQATDLAIENSIDDAPYHSYILSFG